MFPARPFGIVKDQNGVRTDRDGSRDFDEMQVHRLDISVRKHETGGQAASGTGRAEQASHSGSDPG